MSELAQAKFSEPVAAELVREGWLREVERRCSKLIDRLNPILVKETRQALKSRQFVITFGLLLICCWAWSILGLWVMGPEVSYGVRGSEMLLGYYVILAFPLLVVVPFGAYRSLASEQEDHTFELLWITSLRPRQIITGKLGSAVLQMVIYLSAISPCLAFTYMLRGVSLPSILFLLVYTVFASVGLSLIGLLIGTLSTEKHIQILLSVLSVLGLFLCFWTACWMAVGEEMFFQLPYADVEFWQVNAAMLTAYGAYFALAMAAAVARITFAADNRSTPLRTVMLAQQVLFTGWMAYGCLQEWNLVYTPWLLMTMIFVGMHWYGMGSFMVGESPELSLRVRRQLPQSFLGRLFLTWFNPGPATGYVFAVAGLLGALAITCLAVGAWELLAVRPASVPWSFISVDSLLVFAVLAVSYATIYLGLGLLVMTLLRRVTRTGLLLSLLIQLLLVLLGCGVPLFVETMMSQGRRTEYSLLQMSNPFWTLAEMTDSTTLPIEAWTLVFVLPVAAIFVFALNLPSVMREIRHVRIAKPARVAEEDAELAGPTAPARLSPWDD